MSGAILPGSMVVHPSERAAGVLTSRLEQYLAGIRPNHPVSILDLSPAETAGIELARWARHLPRKIRLMTYEWREPKNRDRYIGLPEVLVEKGIFPGLHFSQASFDFVVGVDVLRPLAGPDQRRRALFEIARVALRWVDLIENDPGVAGPVLLESELRDSLLECGMPAADLQPVGAMLQILIAKS